MGSIRWPAGWRAGPARFPAGVTPPARWENIPGRGASWTGHVDGRIEDGGRSVASREELRCPGPAVRGWATRPARRGSGPPVSVLFGLLAAIANSGQAVISKGLASRMPARQLIGPLYVANSLVLLPAAPFVAWAWSPQIIALHLVSVGFMAMSAISVWDMFDADAASAATTALALSPLPAALGTAVLVPESFRPAQAAAAVVVTFGVLVALRDAFAGLGRRGTAVRVLGAATGTGLLTVCARLLGDAGSGVVETYVVRTALAAVLFVTLFPPRDVAWREAPRLFVRSLLVTIYFVLVILGAQQGSPVVVQTLVATTPLFALAWEAVQQRSLPPARGVVAAAIVVAGVALTAIV